MKAGVRKGACPHCHRDAWLVFNTCGEVIACWENWSDAMLLANLLSRPSHDPRKEQVIVRDCPDRP